MWAFSESQSSEILNQHPDTAIMISIAGMGAKEHTGRLAEEFYQISRMILSKPEHAEFSAPYNSDNIAGRYTQHSIQSLQAPP